MDNHKDFIHIDEMFKGLRNGEEPEGAGAWLRMKDLLDKELPVGTPVASGWSFRRYMLPLVALLMLGGGVAYYEMSDNNRSGGAGSGPAIAGNTTGNEHTPAASGSGFKPGEHTEGANGQSVATTSARKGNKGAPGHKATGPASPGNSGRENGGGRNIAQVPAAATPPAAVRTTTPAAQPGRGAQPAASLAGKNPGNTPLVSKPAASGKLLASAAGKDPGPLEAAPVVPSEEHVIEKIKPRNQQNHVAPAQSQAASIARQADARIVNPDLQIVAASLGDKKIVRDKKGNFYKELRDTFKRMDLVERSVAVNGNNGGKEFKTVLDTVAVTRIEKVRYTPLDPIELIALRKMGADKLEQPVVLAANLRERTAASEMVSLVPLNNYKVASRKVDPGKFNQLIHNTSQGISNYFDGSRNFYAAFLLGGNASFGNPGAFGMQMGIAGMYSLGERLTLAAELKYVNHYFSNYSLQDESVTFKNVNSQVSGADWLFSGTRQTTTSIYRVKGYSSLELPVTLSYNLGRVSVFAGLNLAYAFPIGWSKETTLSSVDVQQLRPENTNPFINAAFKLDEQKDFASRLGLGYTWGLSYDLSRKVSLDARVSQILLDNNNGNTDALNRLFRLPTVQLSFGYYLGRREKVIYIMDRR